MDDTDFNGELIAALNRFTIAGEQYGRVGQAFDNGKMEMDSPAYVVAEAAWEEAREEVGRAITRWAIAHGMEAVIVNQIEDSDDARPVVTVSLPVIAVRLLESALQKAQRR